jgi:hypothetical protein
MEGRNDTCCRCGAEDGIYECANCREFPICQRCRDVYEATGWKDYGCFCAEPKHVMQIIDSYCGGGERDADDERYFQGWGAAVRCAVEIIEEDS